ncbi:MAG: hypothetical protein KJ043_04945, partial [Anaerolineae bacterium]|nr:hypothetical protein [Anaerolineae bacterium]
MMKVQKFGIWVVFWLFIGGIIAPSGAQQTSDENRIRLYEAVNIARQANGASALILDDTLSRIAQTSIETVGVVGRYDAVSVDSVSQLFERERYIYATFWYAMQMQ